MFVHAHEKTKVKSKMRKETKNEHNSSCIFTLEKKEKKFLVHKKFLNKLKRLTQSKLFLITCTK